MTTGPEKGSRAGRIRILVEIDRQSQPVTGRLRASGGRQHRFVGLLELLAAVEELIGPIDPGS
jgi:hypothetical protein